MIRDNDALKAQPFVILSVMLAVGYAAQTAESGMHMRFIQVSHGFLMLLLFKIRGSVHRHQMELSGHIVAPCAGNGQSVGHQLVAAVNAAALHIAVLLFSI